MRRHPRGGGWGGPGCVCGVRPRWRPAWPNEGGGCWQGRPRCRSPRAPTPSPPTTGNPHPASAVPTVRRPSLMAMQLPGHKCNARVSAAARASHAARMRATVVCHGCPRCPSPHNSFHPSSTTQHGARPCPREGMPSPPPSTTRVAAHHTADRRMSPCGQQPSRTRAMVCQHAPTMPRATTEYLPYRPAHLPRRGQPQYQPRRSFQLLSKPLQPT